MTKVAATVSGYSSVARASEVLHLAPRSVRGLIYAGRLPSLRVGRLHYIKTTEVEAERRRRLGLPLPPPRPVRHRASNRVRRRASPQTELPADQSASESALRPHADPELRRQRAAERAELIRHWAQRHDAFEVHVPASVQVVDGEPVACDACSRQVRRGRYVELTATPDETTRLCTTCARRALLEWADRRRQEAAAARRLSQSLGQPEAAPMRQLDLLVA